MPGSSGDNRSVDALVAMLSTSAQVGH
jgi:hypothetical protein